MIQNLARVYSAELEGIDAKLIEVETDINVGLHSFNIVGLADKALNEAKDRVNSALKNSGIKPPNRENRKITINLAPADVKKTGSQYDLAIALGYLLATKQIKEFEAGDKIFFGELALDGRLRPINGALNIAQMAAELNFKYLFLPEENANEAAAIKNIKIIPLEKLDDVIAILEGRIEAVPKIFREGVIKKENTPNAPDFSEIKGQENAKRALTIAAAGGHNILMIGPPGVGKSFLAQGLIGILPELDISEAIEITKIWSAAGLCRGDLVHKRPFRSPHQTASTIALIGGGQDPRPGEISLAHRGILFLDELPEFQRSALEALRQPMESGVVHIARAKHSLIFPAKFTLVAAMNPCPCGYYGSTEHSCTCSAYEVIKYQKKVSGPLLDRIDLQVKVGGVKVDELRKEPCGEPINDAIKRNVESARRAQRERFAARDLKIQTNAEMSSRETSEMIRLNPGAERLIESFDKNRLSPRSYYRILKVARTIADLDEKDSITADHLAEAFSYRLREEI
jgi:magnesium chelatase family protein